ncbi:MAG TPA: hypothetical protein VED47_08965 [Burkholderiaceae bacterium]|nr:hypothetical protein [Burkholderiaceae bacterium]
MSSLQLSGIVPVIASKPGVTGGGEQAAPPAPNGGPVQRTPRGNPTTARGNEPGASSRQTAGGATPAPASQSSEAIGTQLVLVFDDRTRSMKVKLLDIRTQKVDQPPLPDTASEDAAAVPSESATAVVRVDTKA